MKGDKIMSENKKSQPYYQLRAKEIVDVLFDKNYFKEDVNRDDMQGVEDFIAYTLQSQSEMSVKCALLCKSIKDKK